MDNQISYNFTKTAALITGASTGIGRATAFAFAKNKAQVVAVDVMGFVFIFILFALLFSVTLPTIPSFAQTAPVASMRAESDSIRQQGQLVSIQLILGEPVRIFVVGREEAKIDLNDLSLTVRRLKPYPGKILSVDRYDNYFAISEPVDLKKLTVLEVTTRVKNKSEALQFKIENRIH